MRFGHFFYPMNFDPSRDHQAIEDCLQEAELVEELGMTPYGSRSTTS